MLDKGSKFNLTHYLTDVHFVVDGDACGSNATSAIITKHLSKEALSYPLLTSETVKNIDNELIPIKNPTIVTWRVDVDIKSHGDLIRDIAELVSNTIGIYGAVLYIDELPDVVFTAPNVYHDIYSVERNNEYKSHINIYSAGKFQEHEFEQILRECKLLLLNPWRIIPDTLTMKVFGHPKDGVERLTYRLAEMLKDRELTDNSDYLERPNTQDNVKAGTDWFTIQRNTTLEYIDDKQYPVDVKFIESITINKSTGVEFEYIRDLVNDIIDYYPDVYAVIFSYKNTRGYRISPAINEEELKLVNEEREKLPLETEGHDVIFELIM